LRKRKKRPTHWCTSGGGDLAEQPAGTSSQWRNWRRRSTRAISLSLCWG
jgi:hypothetical protein